MRKTIVILLSLVLCGGAFAQELDKVELEKRFMEGLALYEGPFGRSVPDNLQRIDKDLYASDSGNYEVESVRTVAFFRRVKGQYIPLRDKNKPESSIATLLCGYTGDTDYTVSFKQHRYNYATAEVDVSLNRLLGFCINGCGLVPYVGFEKEQDGLVKATLFLVDNERGYAHTFHFTIDKDILSDVKGTLQADAYTFTPIHNLAK